MKISVFEKIEFFGGVYGVSRSEIKTQTNKPIADLGLQKEAKKLVGELPIGWKQKLAFSVAIFHRPKIVFLDEPTGGVAPVTRRQFWDMIYQAASSGITIFVTTHYMDEAEYCNRISIMVDGRLEALARRWWSRSPAESMDEVFYQLARSAGEREINYSL
jgi:ABC-2 type transport system ATP-binding protein